MRATQVCLVTGLALAWAFACSSGSDAPEHSDGSGSGGTAGGGASSGDAGAAASSAGSGALAGSGGTAGGAASGQGADGGSGGSTRDAGELPDVVFEYDPGDAGEPDACASSTIEAEPVPLDLVVILDSSGSMAEDPNGDDQPDCDVDQVPQETSKWCRAIDALMDFFEAPTSVGMGVAYRDFTAADQNDCPDFPTMDVDFGIITDQPNDPQLAALEAAMNADGPGVWTPTESALEAIVAQTNARQAANVAAGDTDRKVIGILVTDGRPQGGCENDVDVLDDIVDDHFTNTGIPTFMIGMTGARFTQLEVLADDSGAPQHDAYCNSDGLAPTSDLYGGSGPPCYYYDVRDGNGTVLIDALNDIRRSVIGCQFAMPTPDQGLVDIDSIEVKFTPSGGAPEETLSRVTGGESNCTGEGYFFDTDTDPTTILLCPDTCTRAENDPDSTVSIELLCEGS